MKQTKEQLLATVTKLEHERDAILELDKEVRREFSKALEAPVKKDGYTNERTIYSWEEIFCELGKLIGMDAYKKLEKRLSEVERERMELSERLRRAKASGVDPDDLPF